MYLLYADESGDVAHPESEHVVVAGLAVHESGIRALGRETEAVIARHLDPHLRGLELHAQAIRSGKGPWRKIPKPVKDALLADVAELLAGLADRSAAGLALFAVAREPGAVLHADPLERIYEELALRFNSYLAGGGRDERGVIVADEAKYEKIVQPLVADWRAGGGSRFGRLTRIVEVPLFLDSAASRQVQLADFVAHAVFLNYERRESDLFSRLLPAFHSTGTSIHGLVHLSPRHLTCPCEACSSRRVQQMPGMPE